MASPFSGFSLYCILEIRHDASMSPQPIPLINRVKKMHVAKSLEFSVSSTMIHRPKLAQINIKKPRFITPVSPIIFIVLSINLYESMTPAV
jgi:hypothetical protein